MTNIQAARPAMISAVLAIPVQQSIGGFRGVKGDSSHLFSVKFCNILNRILSFNDQSLYIAGKCHLLFMSESAPTGLLVLLTFLSSESLAHATTKNRSSDLNG